MEGDACNPKRGYKLHLRLQQAHPGEQRGALPAEEAEPSFPGEGGETEGAFTGDRWAAQEDEGSGDDAVTAQRARAWCPWSVWGAPKSLQMVIAAMKLCLTLTLTHLASLRK